MKIIEMQHRTPQQIAQLVEVWESSVRATHHFLSDAEVEQIKQYVPQALTEVAHLFVAQQGEQSVGFMGIEKDSLEMLFLAPQARGKGLGKQLLQEGIVRGVRRLTVNEQNPQARIFYEHMGFRVYKRTDCDEQGNPYPLLYMELTKKREA